MTRSSSWWYGMIRCALPDSLTRRRVDALAREHVELGESTAGSTTTPLPMTGGDVRVQHAARHELEREHLAADDDAVAGVVATLVADDERRSPWPGSR